VNQKKKFHASFMQARPAIYIVYLVEKWRTLEVMVNLHKLYSFH